MSMEEVECTFLNALRLDDVRLKEDGKVKQIEGFFSRSLSVDCSSFPRLRFHFPQLDFSNAIHQVNRVGTSHSPGTKLYVSQSLPTSGSTVSNPLPTSAIY